MGFKNKVYAYKSFNSIKLKIPKTIFQLYRVFQKKVTTLNIDKN